MGKGDAAAGLLPREGWVKGQHTQGLSQHTRPQTQHPNLYIPITVVDHAQVDVHPSGDAD